MLCNAQFNMMLNYVMVLLVVNIVITCSAMGAYVILSALWLFNYITV